MARDKVESAPTEDGLQSGYKGSNTTENQDKSSKAEHQNKDPNSTHDNTKDRNNDTKHDKHGKNGVLNKDTDTETGEEWNKAVQTIESKPLKGQNSAKLDNQDSLNLPGTPDSGISSTDEKRGPGKC